MHQNGLLPSVPPLAAPLHAEIVFSWGFLGGKGHSQSRLPPWRAGAGAGWEGVPSEPGAELATNTAAPALLQVPSWKSSEVVKLE